MQIKQHKDMANAKKKDIEELRKENAEATVSSAEKFYNLPKEDRDAVVKFVDSI